MFGGQGYEDEDAYVTRRDMDMATAAVHAWFSSHHGAGGGPVDGKPKTGDDG